MQFALEVTWNGRRYTVVRSLHRMRQLRDELVSELGVLQPNKKVTVPELPSLPGNGGSSFTLLQALQRSHVPALEAWLGKVFALVSSVNESATLTNFVLEPICSLHTPVKRLPLSERLPLLLRRSSLSSIEEDDETDPECD